MRGVADTVFVGALALALAILSPGFLAADYPRIDRLGNDDVLYRQLQQDIGAYHRAAAGGNPLPPLVIYQHTPQSGDLLSLCARLNLPYDTVATLNALENTDEFKEGQTILVPNTPGLFVPEEATSDFQEILISSSQTQRTNPVRVVLTGREGERTLFFYPGDRFNAIERAFFLQILFRYPLARRGRLSSGYGSRRDPFSGENQFHGGIDLVAPTGTEVLAAREGQVVAVGWDDTYGNYVIIEHSGGYQTLYGHMKQVLVSLNQEVRSGMIIGEVGTTGLTTGPHLHFEIRRKGAWRNPLPLIR